VARKKQNHPDRSGWFFYFSHTLDKLRPFRGQRQNDYALLRASFFAFFSARFSFSVLVAGFLVSFLASCHLDMAMRF